MAKNLPRDINTIAADVAGLFQQIGTDNSTLSDSSMISSYASRKSAVWNASNSWLTWPASIVRNVARA